jgi:hypothetical protein
MTIDDIVIKIYPSKSKNITTLAYVNLSIPQEIEGIKMSLNIDGYRIMTDSYGNSPNGFRLIAPCIKKGFKYEEIVFLEGNKEIWFKLQNKILKKYEQEVLTDEMELDAS